MINPIELATDELYFADKLHMSVSAWKRFSKCEVMGLEPFGEMTESMMIGSYVDAYISGTLEQFKDAHPEIISSKGATKGELKAGFKNADLICEYLGTKKTFTQFMSGEKQVVMTGEIAGVPFKIKIDSYSAGIAINDLKCMASVTNKNGEYIDFISPWGYDVQMACYQEIVRQNTGEKLPCFICAVTKETPINSVIVGIEQPYLDIALYRVQESIEHFYDVKMGKIEPIGCNKCDYCISKRPDTEIVSFSSLLNI